MTQQEMQKALKELLRQEQGKRIIDGTNDDRQFRADGYTNLLNRYGTTQDNSTAYGYQSEPLTDDMELTALYEGNGLFAKIIDRPAEESMKHGLDIDFGSEDISEYVENRLDELNFEDQMITAEKWARLYGGAIAVLIVNDGRGLEEPLEWKSVRSIEDIRVFERAIVQPDYSDLYVFNFEDSLRDGWKMGDPKRYYVFSTYGYFTVHASRCLVFRNGRMPEHVSDTNYRFWGMPEHVKIRNALQQCMVAHEDGVKLLERSVQAIYKMHNLANLLSTQDGEDQVLKRLQVIDMARGILNSIAIDNDGEDYDFKTLPLSGVKDIIDTSCSMLSAVTDIPQTVLFGDSPTGMDATGESDLENYYNMVEGIQKMNLKSAVRKVVKLILIQGCLEGRFDNIPTFKVKFAPLWSLSEKEQAEVDAAKAGVALTQMQVATGYAQAGILDPTEIRKNLAANGEFVLDDAVQDDPIKVPEGSLEMGQEEAMAGQPGQPQETAQEAAGAAGEAAGQTASANGPEGPEGATDAVTEAKNKIIDFLQGKKAGEQKAAAEPEDSAESLKQQIIDLLSTQTDEDEVEALKEELIGVLQERDPDSLKLQLIDALQEALGEQDADTEGMKIQLIDALQDYLQMDEEERPKDLPTGVGVLVIKDGKILVGTRTDNGLTCGPGGHMQEDEKPEDSAKRETLEEFGIFPLELHEMSGFDGRQFWCDCFSGAVKTDDVEMTDPRWVTLRELAGMDLYEPFKKALLKYIKEYIINLTGESIQGIINADGGPGSGRYPKGSGENPRSDPTDAGINCMSFEEGKREDHFKRHGAVMGYKTEEEYEKGAIDFLKQPVGGTIEGFTDKFGKTYRFDSSNYHYGVGKEGEPVKTYYIPKSDDGVIRPEAIAKYWESKKRNLARGGSHEGT